MTELNLLDDSNIMSNIRTLPVKIIEYILTLMYAALIFVVILTIDFKNIALENIFEELIIVAIVSLCLNYIYLWKKATREFD